MIISKGKYEIISSNATQVLESVLDVYNQLRSSLGVVVIGGRTTSSNSSYALQQQLYTHKSRVNLCLANLIKWSDTEVLLAASSRRPVDNSLPNLDDSKINDTRLVAESSALIKALSDAINDLVKFCQTELFVSNSSKTLPIVEISFYTDYFSY